MAKLNMTDTSQQCPNSFVERNESGIRQCRIRDGHCFSVIYSTAGTFYSRICGRIAAHQIGTTDAFQNFYANQGVTINSTYVDGVSLTHGGARQHIWTFAAALDRGQINNMDSKCPCVEAIDRIPPPFVGEDYFCDSSSTNTPAANAFQMDPLWD